MSSASVFRLRRRCNGPATIGILPRTDSDSIGSYAATERFFWWTPHLRAPLGRILVDDAGWIWVQDYPRGREAMRQWLVLDERGVPRARLETPHDLEVHTVAAGVLVGRQRDDFGVERISVYDIERE